MKITKSKLKNMIRETLAEANGEREAGESIAGTGKTRSASARYAQLRKKAGEALDAKEVSGQEREILDLVLDFFEDLAATEGVELNKARITIDQYLKRLEAIILKQSDTDTAGKPAGKPASGEEEKDPEVNVPRLG